MPAQSQILEVSEKTPLLAMFLWFDMPTVREVLSSDDVPEPAGTPQRQGLAVGDTTTGLLNACNRLLDLIETRRPRPRGSGC